MSTALPSGHITWKSPSNIAIVKYWGKYGNQLPRNCSLSLTLDHAHTVTKLVYKPKLTKDAKISLRFYFEGKLNPQFGAKAMKFMESIRQDLYVVTAFDFEIHTENTFPHSSGIASSASGMSALVACLLQLEHQVKLGAWTDDAHYRQQASYYSRLGSGSACRSLYPIAASWGQHPDIQGSSDAYASPHGHVIHEVFHTYHDDILIVSKNEKSVSSSAGHGLMEGNPFAEARYLQANQNISKLLRALQTGDLETFGHIAEEEALTLHALMMCSNPSFILMEPHTISLIQKIRSFRMDTNLPVYFTLDAGPNIHLLYPDHIANQVRPWIQQELKAYCQEGKIIQDQVGQGSSLVAENE